MQITKKIQLIIEKSDYLKNIIKAIYIPTIGRYKKFKQSRLLAKEGKNALFQIDKAFKELDIDYWLEFGTLLGAVREKDFISHDVDIDIAMFIDDFQDKNEAIITKYGFKKLKEFLVDNGKYAREETYVYKGISVDIFYFHRKNNKMYTHTFAPEKGKSRFKTIEEKGGLLVCEWSYPDTGFKLINFLGIDFLAPSNIEEHLKATYGANFMVKDPNYTDEIATNIRIVPDKIGIRRLYG